MNVKRLRTSVAAAMGGAVLMAGLLVGASFALAQETTEPEVTVEQNSPERGFHSFRDDARIMGGDLDAIDQLVEDGLLTQEQADAIKERLESFDPESRLPFGSRDLPLDRLEGLTDDRHPFDGMREFGDLGGFLDELGLDVDLAELGDLFRSGASLDELLDGMDLDLDVLVEDATAAALAHLDELVADGTMTQEQADHIKEMIESFDLSEGFPFGLRDMDFDFDFDMDHFDMDRFRGHGDDHFGFFDGDCTGDKNAEDVLLDV